VANSQLIMDVIGPFPTMIRETVLNDCSKWTPELNTFEQCHWYCFQTDESIHTHTHTHINWSFRHPESTF